MMTFYKISKTDANTIGKFYYGEELFNPFCSEQVDGTYLVSVDLVNQLATNENITKVNWSGMTIINESQINNKYVSIP